MIIIDVDVHIKFVFQSKEHMYILSTSYHERQTEQTRNSRVTIEIMFYLVLCCPFNTHFRVKMINTVYFPLPVLTACLCTLHVLSCHVLSCHCAAPAAATGSTGFGLPAAAPTAAADAAPVLGNEVSVCTCVCVCVRECE